jgi:hypothetical protein
MRRAKLRSPVVARKSCSFVSVVRRLSDGSLLLLFFCFFHVQFLDSVFRMQRMTHTISNMEATRMAAWWMQIFLGNEQKEADAQRPKHNKQASISDEFKK